MAASVATSGDAVMAAVDTPLFLGRQAFERRAWSTAYAHLSAADRVEHLLPADLERLALAAYLSGRDERASELMTRAYQEFVALGELPRAARCAFWHGMTLFDRGQAAPGSGWLARARRLLDEHQLDCVERGYLLLPDGIGLAIKGDFEAARVVFVQAASIGDRFADNDLRALARQAQGRALARLGRVADGVSLLDEAMVGVMTDEVSPMAAGVVYCSVIEACAEIFDLKRAHEWTDALGRWCDSQPELVPYRGQCLIRRSEVLQMRGQWSGALNEAAQACERLAQRPNHAGLAAAFYQLAEVHRLRGESSEAADAYRAASQHGKVCEPGWALLRLADGQVAAAAAAIRRAREEVRDVRTRATVLCGAVDICIAAGDVAAARASAEELATIAATCDRPLLTACATQAIGAVLLAESSPEAALAPLRQAFSIWQELDVPYEIARVRVLLARACRGCGDAEAAALEFDAARRSFEQMGAGPDLARLNRLTDPPGEKPVGGLTSREKQVLGLVATGRTNRAIAQQLRISEKTVARHLANIFTKLGVSTRSAATAYAYRHRLNSSA